MLLKNYHKTSDDFFLKLIYNVYRGVCMKIIAHRGKDIKYGENSLRGIINSLNNSYTDGVEFDIRMTLDFKFVIHHDPFYKGKFIRLTTLKKLKKLGLDSLEDVLKEIKTKKIVLIEIKEESRSYRILVCRLYKLLKKYNINYHIISFNYDLMKYFKKKHPEIKNGLLIGVKKNIDKIDNNFDFNAVNYRHAAKSKNKETFVWTVNDLEEFSQVQKNQNIITDEPLYFYNLINKKN